MADYLLSYDLAEADERTRTIFEDRLRAAGWKTAVKREDGKRYRLPNTTRIGPTFGTAGEAKRAYLDAVDRTREDAPAPTFAPSKVVISPYSDVYFVSDQIEPPRPAEDLTDKIARLTRTAKR